MKKINNANGGYSVIYYYNDSNQSVDELEATHGYIAEFDSNNNLINEISFVRKSETDNKNEENNNIDLLEDTAELPKISL